MELSAFRKAQFRMYGLAEPRAVVEWQGFFALRPLLKRLPKGDGHSVIVFPGFGGSDRSTWPMRNLLEHLDYRVYGWGLGQNLLFDHDLESEMVAMVKEEADRSGGKVSLIGWSLGGLYAREVAKDCASDVRSVISLGSPIAGRMRLSSASKFYRALNGNPSDLDRMRFEGLPIAPPVPTTSVYSKTDGIVAWEASHQKGHDRVENIEVPASHLGIGVNPLVMAILADRLSQQEDAWAPFQRKWWNKLLVKTPKSS